MRMRVPGIEVEGTGPGRECLCFDLHLHMQREGRQWTQTTRAVCNFWSFGLLRTPSLLQHAHTAHMPCDIVGSHATARVASHVVFVAQCNGWVLHVITIT